MKRPLIILILLLGTPLFSDNSTESLKVHLLPSKQVTLKAKVTGTLQIIYKKIGQRVEKNEVIATLDSTLFLAEKKRAEAFYADTFSALEAKEELFNDHLISASQIEEIRYEVLAAERDLLLAQDAYQNCSIRAPFAGVIANINASAYEYVSAGTSLASVVDDTALLANFSIPLRDYSAFHIGDTLRLTIPGIQPHFEAIVDSIAPMAEGTNNSFQAYALLENKDHLLFPGMQGHLITSGE